MLITIIGQSCPDTDEGVLVGGSDKAPYRAFKYLERLEGLNITYAYFRGPKSNKPNRVKIPTIGGKLYLKTIMREFGVLILIRKFFRSDILQIHHPHFALVAGFTKWALRRKTKIFVKAHGTALPEFKTLKEIGLRGKILEINSRFHFWHDKNALRYADLCICSSVYQMKEMEKLYQVPRHKLVTVYNGYDSDYFPAKVEKIYNSIILVARLVPKKNVNYALDLFDELNKTGEPYSLTIVGGTKKTIENRKTHNEICRRVSITPNARILFDLTEAQLAEEYAKAEIFLCPSKDYESIPSVIYEALASKCQIFSAYQWGIPEILPEGCALSFNLKKDALKIAGRNYKPKPISHHDFSYEAVATSYRGLYD